jgi:major vault protein
VAVPRGEGRYVLDREEGEVKLVKGPKMLLPDPRREVIVLRVLDENQVALMYPGNAKALEVNRTLKAELESSAVSVGSQRFAARALADAPDMESVQAKSAFAGESIQRGTTFRKPRTLTLDNKYEGAVCVSPYPGFAILVVNKSGERRVVEGPATILLEYDESLMPMELSTGTPKSDTRTLKTAYLQVKNNRVSDRVTVETRDLVPVDVTVAYRVNFEGDHLKWFNVDNYVRHLTEHGRSMLRGAVKRVGIEEFYRDPISIIRDALLGKAVEGGERKGLVFAENGMRVYDVDVLEVKIENTEIAELLGNAQVEALESTLQVAAKERELATTTRVHAVERQIVEEQTKTEKAKANLQMEFVRLALTKALAEADSRAQKEAADLKALQERQGGFDAVAKAELARAKAKKDQELAAVEQELEIAIKREVQQTEDITKRASAISDKLIAALQAFGDKELMSHVAEAMAPLAIFRNSGVVEAFAGLLKGSPLEGALQLAAATTPKK